MARPTKYDESFVAKADEYLKLCEDEDVTLLKQEGKLGSSWDNKLKVHLPTIEGFADFLEVNKTTLYEWAEIYSEFSNALSKVKAEQHKRLVDKGLSGDYNPTIAKLILSSNHGYREGKDVTSDGKQIKPNEMIIVDFSDGSED